MKGNQFWKLRSKHGRDKLFATPELLWKAACEYFENTDSRKWIKKDWVGKDALQVDRENETPYTISGLCLYLDVSRSYFDDFEDGLKGKTDSVSLGFSLIITRIRNIILTQKIEGAAVGAFNANIIARETGMVDQQAVDHTTKGEKIAEQKIDFSKLSVTALKELSDAIKANGG